MYDNFMWRLWRACDRRKTVRQAGRRADLMFRPALRLLAQRRVSAVVSSPHRLTSPLPLVPSARKLSTTTLRYAALTQQTPAQSIVVLQTPSPEYLEQEELDVEPLSPDQIQLIITDRAAEVCIYTLLLRRTSCH
jgi:hypothetical protein